MEWVETTAKTVEDAKDQALDTLGVDETEAEFEVLEEPRQGLFGRTRGEARIRARVKPKAPRAKDDRRDRRRKRGRGRGEGGRSDSGRGEGGRSDSGRSSAGKNESGRNERAAAAGGSSNGRGDDGGTGNRQGGPKGKKRSGGNERSKDRSESRSKDRQQQKEEASMEDVRTCVDEFLTGLTTAFGIDTSVTIDTDDEEIRARIEGKHGLLLGPKARTLDAIQELTRVTAQRTAPSSIRIKVDVGGYRDARREALARFAENAAEKAQAEQVEVALEPMSSADRKVVHDALTDVAGVSTRSAGTDPRRFVVVVPELDAAADGGEDPEPAGAAADD